MFDVRAKDGWRGRQSRGWRGGTRQWQWEIYPQPHVSPARLPPALPRPQVPRVCHSSEEQSLSPGGWREQASLGPARAGPRARAGWAAGSLAGRTWSALLCLRPLQPDSLINDPPGLRTSQQLHFCGSGRVDLPTLPLLLLRLVAGTPGWAEML